MTGEHMRHLCDIGIIIYSIIAAAQQIACTCANKLVESVAARAQSYNNSDRAQTLTYTVNCNKFNYRRCSGVVTSATPRRRNCNVAPIHCTGAAFDGWGSGGDGKMQNARHRTRSVTIIYNNSPIHTIY